MIRRHLITIIASLVLIAMGSQMLLAAVIDGATTDEQIHILSGYATITDAHILFDPEHPFLAKALAALPLLVVQPAIPNDADNLDPAKANVEYNTYAEANLWGYQMLFEMGNNPEVILWLTRAVIALLTVLLGLVVYRWTKSMFGTASAVAALVIIAIDPTILAHGHLANNDTVAALMFVSSLAAFHHYLKQPSLKSLCFTGIIFGLGLITKFSLVLLGPIFVLLLLLWFAYHRHKKLPAPQFGLQIKQSWLRYSLGLVAIFFIGWIVIWIGYGSLMLINPAYNPQTFMNSAMPEWLDQLISVTLPVMWAKGAYYLFGPHAHFRDGYLLGECYLGGRWDYFAIVSAVKIPLITLGLFVSTLVIWWKKRKSIGFDPIMLLVPAGFYFLVSSLSDINIGFRHVLPAYALFIIIASYPFSLIDWRKVHGQIRAILNQLANLKVQNPKSEIRLVIPALLLLVALVSLIVVGLRTYPNYLPYYNALAQEPQDIPYISSDSNIDWGQGSKQLKQYIIDNNIKQIAFDNFTGTGEAKHYGLPLIEVKPTDHDFKGYIALSRSTMIDHFCTKNNDWGWVIDNYEPVAIIGNSVNLYYIN